MKILSWNITRIGRKGFVAQTQYLMSKYNLDILTLMETRVHLNKAHNVIEKLNLHNVVETSPNGFLEEFDFYRKIKLTLKVK